MWVHDLGHSNSRFDHKFLDKGLYIWIQYMQDLMDNQNLKHTQVDILRRDSQCNLASSYKIQHFAEPYKWHWNHKVMEYMDLVSQLVN